VCAELDWHSDWSDVQGRSQIFGLGYKMLVNMADYVKPFIAPSWWWCWYIINPSSPSKPRVYLWYCLLIQVFLFWSLCKSGGMSRYVVTHCCLFCVCCDLCTRLSLRWINFLCWRFRCALMVLRVYRKKSACKHDLKVKICPNFLLYSQSCFIAMHCGPVSVMVLKFSKSAMFPIS